EFPLLAARHEEHAPLSRTQDRQRGDVQCDAVDRAALVIERQRLGGTFERFLDLQFRVRHDQAVAEFVGLVIGRDRFDGGDDDAIGAGGAFLDRGGARGGRLAGVNGAGGEGEQEGGGRGTRAPLYTQL